MESTIKMDHLPLKDIPMLVSCINSLLPALRERYGDLPAVIGGYSLGGLFSLWAAAQTDSFRAVAAALMLGSALLCTTAPLNPDNVAGAVAFRTVGIIGFLVSIYFGFHLVGKMKKGK